MRGRTEPPSHLPVWNTVEQAVLERDKFGDHPPVLDRSQHSGIQRGDLVLPRDCATRSVDRKDGASLPDDPGCPHQTAHGFLSLIELQTGSLYPPRCQDRLNGHPEPPDQTL